MAAPTIVTTGHDPKTGLSVFVPSAETQAFTPHVGIIYSTDGKPLDLNGDADLKAFAARDHSALIPTEGAVMLVAEWAPSSDSRDKPHRTPSVDVGVMIQGEVECHLDSGESRTLKQGDILVQRGTMHAAVNRSPTVPARMLCFVMPAKPFDGAKQ